MVEDSGQNIPNIYCILILMILTFSCHVGFSLDQGVFDVAWLIRHGAVQLMGQLPHPQ